MTATVGVRRRHVWSCLVATAVGLRLPGFVVRLVNSDEASLATMGAVLERGGRLYHQTADRKPPLVPYIYAAVFHITGSTDLRPVRVVATASLVATAALLVHEVRVRHEDQRLALLCGVLFLLAYGAFFPDDSQAATFELFSLLPMTGAVLAARRDRPVLAGVLLALATLCKQTALVTLLPVAYLVHRRRGVPGAVPLGVGLAAPIALAAAVLGPRPFLLWTVTGNGGYLGGAGSIRTILLRGTVMTASLAALEVGLIVLCAAAARRRCAPADLWLWLLSGAVAVVAGFRFFGHYYLPLLPPATLVAASALTGMAATGRRVATGLLVAPALVCTVIGFFPTGDATTLPVATLAEAVRATSAPTATMFVWGDLPELYWASGRTPATRFIHTGFLTGSSGGRAAGAGTTATALPGAWAMLRLDLRHKLPDLIVDTSTGRIRGQQHYPMQATWLGPLVQARYELASVVDGVRIYRRTS